MRLPRIDRSRVFDVLISLGVGAALVCVLQVRALAKLAARAEVAVSGSSRLMDSLAGAIETTERWGRALESATYDQRIAVRAWLSPQRPTDPKLTFVEIDDIALTRQGRWPWPRARQAQLIDCLKRLGCRGLLTDIEYPEPSAPVPGQADPDALLARALARPSDGRPGPDASSTPGAAFGVTYLEVAGSPERHTREHAHRRLIEWATGVVGDPAPRLPRRLAEELRGAGFADPWKAADRMVRIARAVAEQPQCTVTDVVLARAVPGLEPPLPDQEPPIHPAQLMPAVLEAVTRDERTSPEELARRTIQALGYGPDLLNDPKHAGFAKSYVPALVVFCRNARAALDELSDELGRVLLITLARWIREAQAARPRASDAEVLDAVKQRMGLPAGEPDQLLEQVFAQRKSLDVFWKRDLVPARAAWLERLPLFGGANPPVRVLAQAYRGLGVSTVERDLGGVLRSQRLLFRVEASSLDPSPERDALPARLAFHATLPIVAYLRDLDLARLDVGPDHLHIPPRGAGTGLVVPIDGRGRMLIDFRGKWGADGIGHVGAQQLLWLVDMRTERDQFLQKEPGYAIPAAAAAALRGLVLPIVTPLAAAVPLHAPPAVVSGMLDDRAQQARNLAIQKLSLDVRMLLVARDDAVARKETAEIKEIDELLRKQRLWHDVIAVRLPQLEADLENRIQGQFCLVGVSATSTTDVSATPLQELYINLGVHANLLAQMLTGQFVIRAPWLSVDMMILLAYLLAVPLIVPLLSIQRGALAVGGMVAFHIALSTWLLVQRGLWIDGTTPVIATFLGYLAITLRRYLGEERQKERIRSMFSTYLDRRVVEAMIADPSLFEEIGGTTREISAFFSDIEGFTTISELLDSDELSTMLQEYLTPMTERILTHNGLRDKYIGDAIVAIFGAPYPSTDHAAQACLASIEQVEKLAELKAHWIATNAGWYRRIRENGLDLNFRIGLNTGRAKVGNFGSRDAKNYTMIGDAVNLAARLEGANKAYKTRIMITETTYMGARSVIEARELDLLKVVGKVQPVTVYEVLGRKGGVPAAKLELAARFHDALVLYRARRFDEARAAFAALDPADGPTATYLKRLEDRAWLATLTPEWDGSYASKEK